MGGGSALGEQNTGLHHISKCIRCFDYEIKKKSSHTGINLAYKLLNLFLPLKILQVNPEL